MAIDEGFYNSRAVVGNHLGHHVFGPISGPKKLGIHGSTVAVDFDICIADGACLPACPVNVFDWLETPGCESPNAGGELKAQRKADPARESECILCMACEGVCPVLAIKITDPSGLPELAAASGDIGIAGAGAAPAAPAAKAAPAAASSTSGGATAAAAKPAAKPAAAPKPAAAAPAPEPPKVAEKVTAGAAAALAQAQEALKSANEALAAAMKAAALAQELANKAVEEQKKG